MCQNTCLVLGRIGRRRAHTAGARASVGKFLRHSAEARFLGVRFQELVGQEPPTRCRLVCQTILSARVEGACWTVGSRASNRVPLVMPQPFCSR